MPILRPALNHIFLYLFAAIPLSGAAQTIPDTSINTAFAPVTLLEDHPTCNQPGDAAFSVAMNMEDLHFRLAGPSWGGGVDVRPIGRPESTADCSIVSRRGTTGIRESRCTNSNSTHSIAKSPVSEQRPCFITERRGTELIRRETLCELTNTPRNLSDLVIGKDMQLGVQAEVTICQSLTSYRILEGHWSASLALDDEIVDYEGQLSLPGSLDCRDADQPFEPNVRVSYIPADQPVTYFETIIRYRHRPTLVRLQIDNMAIPLPDTEDSPVVLETAAVFFPTVNGQAICKDDRCENADRYSFEIGSNNRWRACRQ